MLYSRIMKNSWYNNDDFWRACAPFLFPARRRADAALEIGHVEKLLGLQAGSRILDLCCGVGRHSLELSRRGYTVTAVDRTEIYLNEARAQAQEEDLFIELVHADMRDFCRPDTFDAVINLFTSFGYFADPNDDRRVLSNVLASLKPGGQLVMDVMGRELIARGFRERDWHREGDKIILEERSFKDEWSWCENRWIVIDGTDRKEFVISHRLYSGHELRALLESCGFRDVRIYGHLSGVPYDQRATRLVATAMKAK